MARREARGHQTPPPSPPPPPPPPSLPRSAGGLVNKFRNGTMDIWQRGTSSLTATTSGAYTADGWIVLPTGASVTCSQVTAGASL